MTTIHVRYEILDDPARPHPDSPVDAYPWGVRAVGLPGNASAYGVGDTSRVPSKTSAKASGPRSARAGGTINEYRLLA